MAGHGDREGFEFYVNSGTFTFLAPECHLLLDTTNNFPLLSTDENWYQYEYARGHCEGATCLGAYEYAHTKEGSGKYVAHLTNLSLTNVIFSIINSSFLHVISRKFWGTSNSYLRTHTYSYRKRRYENLLRSVVI